MPATPQDPRLAYVVDCLRKNPLWQTDEILAARGEALGIQAETPPAERAAEEADRQQRLRRALQTVREAVWEAPVEKLERGLDRLAAEDDPGLQEAIDRLRVAVASREKLAGLRNDRRFSQSFLDVFQRVITAPPRAAAEIRERAVDSFRDHAIRKRGRKMIALMRSKAPELCQLEAEWLGRLTQQKAASQRTREAQDSGRSWLGGWHWWWIGLLILGRIVAAVARSQSGE